MVLVAEPAHRACRESEVAAVENGQFDPAHRQRTQKMAVGENRYGAGQGAQSLGVELESSGAFASCQVTRVFKTVCYRAPATSSLQSTSGDGAQIQSMISSFQSNGYSLRQVFAEAAAYCMGN